MAEFKMKLASGQIGKIRTTAKLKFAEDFAPDVYKGYLAQDKKGLSPLCDQIVTTFLLL